MPTVAVEFTEIDGVTNVFFKGAGQAADLVSAAVEPIKGGVSG